MSDTEGRSYTQNFVIGEITLHGIARAIALMMSRKAPGGDEITNAILKQISTITLGKCPHRYQRQRNGGYRRKTSYRKEIEKNKRGKLVEYDSGQTAKPAALTLHLRSVRKTVVVKEAQKQWATSWNNDEAGRGLYALQPTPKTTVLKLHDGLIKGGANKDREDRSSPVFARH